MILLKPSKCILYNVQLAISQHYILLTAPYNVHYISIYVFIIIIVFLENNNLYEYLFDCFICSTVVIGCSLLVFMTLENSARK